METTKTTEKFKSVHQTFSYTPPSAWTNQWSSLAFGIGVIVKTCSDSLFSIGQKNCQLFVAKLRNFLDSHNRMVLY